MTVGELRYCPECRRPWPKGAEFDLRSFRWLDDLPRRVSPSNIDCVIHDGGLGRDRFLVIETKRDGEVIQKGQARLLMALATLAPERLGVRVLSGSTSDLSIHGVSKDSIEARGTATTPARVRSAVASWLSGSRWRDAEAGLEAPAAERAAPVLKGHTHGYAEVESGVWQCVADHYGKGPGCGELYRKPAA